MNEENTTKLSCNNCTCQTRIDELVSLVKTMQFNLLNIDASQITTGELSESVLPPMHVAVLHPLTGDGSYSNPLGIGKDSH